MKIRIIVVYAARYRRGHRWHFVPPVTGIHLAGMTPEGVEVEVIHEQVRPAPIDEGADLIALSFFSGFATRAYAIADAYRRLGVPVVAGGPHVTYWPEEALRHCDAVVLGEAEAVWPKVIADAERGCLQRVYQGAPADMRLIKRPRYDLLESRFIVPRVLQATRGCPYSCSFCSVPDLNPGFRVRPVEHVLADIGEAHFKRGWQERVAWFWDDNLLVNRPWAKRLLSGLAELDRWWLTQASIDIVKDRALLDLMERSGCIGIFLGIESFEAEDLAHVGKRQNRASAYRDAVRALHDRGICVMAGFISGFDGQTPEAIARVADQLQALEFDVPFLSVLTPFRGTRLYDTLNAEGRLLPDRGWGHYNGYNVAFQPKGMSDEALLAAHRRLWRRAFSPAAVAGRLARGARQLRPGGLMLSSAMNGFYGLKRWTGNLPASARDAEPIAHPRPGARGSEQLSAYAVLAGVAGAGAADAAAGDLVEVEDHVRLAGLVTVDADAQPARAAA
ncbi:B12-binding domain-containing radical SAM protein, partial [Myxococcota bacterium]|nr:B12-binding domain-containing radical SAM protein [Myxococcota bacterium]